jgi:hypothetical protein
MLFFSLFDNDVSKIQPRFNFANKYSTVFFMVFHERQYQVYLEGNRWINLKCFKQEVSRKYLPFKSHPQAMVDQSN